ncbi:MAG: hypothetical protein A3D92_07985 [Bacteroidetes bacterium RIFCSPHIGHO2_02_FULL_44_7]|nr:MAG: hypothetical protein A3D92_07985 [Bacteroidetes bacterium RIFCSPHIGHO2_02_FULL_44_7]
MLGPVNAYYSNLIEVPGNGIQKLKHGEEKNTALPGMNRSIHEEVKAYNAISKRFRSSPDMSEKLIMPYSTRFIQQLHAEFYTQLPEEVRLNKGKDGHWKIAPSGTFRAEGLEIGNHLAPPPERLSSYMERFEEFYNPTSNLNRSKIKRIISIAASHHRLAWIHPFSNGNGRIVRLFSEACLLNEKLDASGLWSMSRGLASNKEEYLTRLAKADSPPSGDFDGRGKLSKQMLIEFCIFFLQTAISEIDFMYATLDLHGLLNRIQKFGHMMAAKGDLRPEATIVLCELFLKGQLSKVDAMKITDLSDKTLKITIDALQEMGLLTSKKEGVKMSYYPQYTAKYSSALFPELLPNPTHF